MANKVVFIPYGKKSYQQPTMSAIYQSFIDPGMDPNYVKFCIDLISMLIQPTEGMVYIDIPRFLKDNETIINQLQGAQIYEKFKPEISCYDLGRHLAALFYVMRKLTIVEDATLIDYLSPTRRGEADKVLNKILGLSFIKNKLTRAIGDHLQIIEGFKLFLSTILECQNVIFTKVDTFLTLRKDFF